MEEKEVFARSRPPQMDVPVDGNFAGRLTPSLRTELYGWTMLPMVALALAGLLALMLALARAPGAEAILPWTGPDFFRRILVVHVVFALVVWVLGVQGAFTVAVTAQSVGDDRNAIGRMGAFFGRLGVYGAYLSFILLIAPAVADLGEPSLNNYIPLLRHPVFFAGLIMLGVSVALPVLRLILLLAHQRRAEAGGFGLACAGLIYLIAMACIAIAAFTLPQNAGPEGEAEYLVWGGGHILQFANTALMLSAFYLLSRVSLGETPMKPSWFRALMLVLVAAAAAGPLLYLTYVGGDPTQRMTFTYLYWFGLPVPTTIILGSVVVLLFKRRKDLRDGAPELKAVAAALLLFVFGGALGFFEGSVDTRTPAHYHAMLIACALAFMALYFGLFFPLLGRRTARRHLRTAMYLLLAGGQFLHSLGLYIAGSQGVGRKIAGAEQDINTTTKYVALALQGFGGVIAVIGGMIFIFLAGKLLLARQGAGGTAGTHPGHS